MGSPNQPRGVLLPGKRCQLASHLLPLPLRLCQSTREGPAFPAAASSQPAARLAPSGALCLGPRARVSTGPCSREAQTSGRMVCTGLQCQQGRLWPPSPILLSPGMWAGFPWSPGKPAIVLYPCPPDTARTGRGPGTPSPHSYGGSATLSHTPS